MLVEILVIILVWFLFGMTFLLFYGSSEGIEITSVWEHLVILLICFPASVFVMVFFGIYLVIDALKKEGKDE